MVALVGTAVLASATGGTAAPRYRVRTSKVSRGVTLKKILDRRGPNRIRVLTVDPTTRKTFDVALATEELPGHETTSSMARRHGALAAINGDFTLLPGSEGSGRPVNTFIEDGHLKASPLIWGRNFSLSRDELTARVGHTRLRTWMRHPSGEVWDIDAVNPLEPDLDGFTMYTPAGGKLFKPPPSSCAARLLAIGSGGWNGDLNGLSRDFVVDKVVCRRRSLPRRGGNVVATSRTGLNAVAFQASLFPGEVVGYGWSFNRPGVLDTIGGNPDLVEDGRNVSGVCEGSYFCDRNPRTGIGITADGKILMVTVDGRSKRSVGMTLPAFARLFLYLGAESAINLDGGGSTTMVVRDRIVNVPSGSFERPVGSALVLLPGSDPQEAEPTPYVTPTPTPTPTITVSPTETVTPSPTETTTALAAPPTFGRDGWLDGFQAIATPGCQSLLDPASTGGMLDAVATGAIPSRGSLSADLRWALRVFRGRAFCR